MNLEQYEAQVNADFLTFEFRSLGPKGSIAKRIQFTKLNIPNSRHDIYNLAFGDYNKTENKINDLVVSDNKDADKILATVANAVVTFTDNHTDVLVFARGSTPARTRYYIMGPIKALPRNFAIF